MQPKSALHFRTQNGRTDLDSGDPKTRKKSLSHFIDWKRIFHGRAHPIDFRVRA
ncbi:hypothetical protein RBSH_01278 [Rhodopirellula baltica SH28]|uniref:Uncharacterized protein n=1 Tax=Rhodopirellula baltica SH28 TaxID=993517 RepID=K5DKF8_RHOBT|nr:hypothetical protein RBSH_01278 [Rhodopirellula baltica SH28]